MDSFKIRAHGDFGGLETLSANILNYQFASHSHEEYVICVVDHGAERVRCKGETIVAPAGSVVIFNPEIPHDGKATNDEIWRYRGMYPKRSFLKKYIYPESSHWSSKGYFSQSVIEDPLLYLVLSRTFGVLENSHCPAEREGAVIEGLSLLCNLYSDPALGKRVLNDSQKIKMAKDILNSNFNKSIGLTFVAEEIGLQLNYFIRAFRNEVGITPHAYLVTKRVNAVKKLLKSGMPLVDVALKTGFYDQSHMNRHFKLSTGLSPGSYRRQILA